MFLKLANGKEVQIGIRHDTEDGKRFTEVRITLDGQTVFGKASCAAADNFCRLTGRKIAGLRALKSFPRDEKTAIFRRICPEFHRGVTPQSPPARNIKVS